jgi:hypothetical protein
MKEAHRESADLQALATAAERRNVARVGDEIHDPVDLSDVDAHHRAAQIVDRAGEQSRVGRHEASQFLAAFPLEQRRRLHKRPDWLKTTARPRLPRFFGAAARENGRGRRSTRPQPI